MQDKKLATKDNPKPVQVPVLMNPKPKSRPKERKVKSKFKGEHESGSCTSTRGFICGKTTGQVMHRFEFLGGTGLCRSG